MIQTTIQALKDVRVVITEHEALIKGGSLATVRFHEKLIRLGKGCLSAWEEWLKDIQKPT